MLSLLTQWDTAILLALQQSSAAFADALLVAYTHLGDAGAIWIALSFVLLLFPKTRKAGFLSLLAMGTGPTVHQWYYQTCGSTGTALRGDRGDRAAGALRRP